MSQIIHLIFLAYMILIGVRIAGSWFPDIASQSYMVMIGQLTDPYLNIFRRFIPPIGGVLDLSPVLGFLTLQFAENVIRSFFK